MNRYTTLIEAGALHALPAAEVLIVDCRFELADPAQARRDYVDGHIPGAVHASLDHDLSDLSRQSLGLGRHPLPDEAAFGRLLSSWGWRPGLEVVAYDTHGGAMAAARLWWMLRLAGIPSAVLDGGYAAWVDAGYPAAAGDPAPREKSSVDVHYDAHQVVLDHAQLLHQDAWQLLDARAAPRFRGEVEPLDRVGGHVPGARNRPFADNLDADGHFKPVAELRAEFAARLAGVAPGHVVHMCGSGVTACHNLLAMEYAGLCGSRLYAPSWSGWSSDPSRPVATGA